MINLVILCAETTLTALITLHYRVREILSLASRASNCRSYSRGVEYPEIFRRGQICRILSHRNPNSQVRHGFRNFVEALHIRYSHRLPVIIQTRGLCYQQSL